MPSVQMNCDSKMYMAANKLHTDYTAHLINIIICSRTGLDVLYIILGCHLFICVTHGVGVCMTCRLANLLCFTTRYDPFGFQVALIAH